jgi:hypothetical protein
MPDGNEKPPPGSILLKLEGCDKFLGSCERCLNPPYDPYCVEVLASQEGTTETQPFGLWLYSRILNRLPEAAVLAGATTLLTQLRGAIEIAYRPTSRPPPAPVSSSPANSIRFVRIGAEGAKATTWTSFALTIEVREEEPRFDLPQVVVGESEVQKWLAAGEENEDIATILTFASRYDN